MSRYGWVMKSVYVVGCSDVTVQLGNGVCVCSGTEWDVVMTRYG